MQTRIPTSAILVICAVGLAAPADVALVAADDRPALPSVWNEIVSEVREVRSRYPEVGPERYIDLMERAAMLANGRSRAAIIEMHRSASVAEKQVPLEVQQAVLKFAALMILEIANSNGISQLRENAAEIEISSWTEFRLISIVAIDSYHDAESQAYLARAAFGDRPSDLLTNGYLCGSPLNEARAALHLLRGYEPGDLVQTVTSLISSAPGPVEGYDPAREAKRVYLADLRGVLAAWAHAARLPDRDAREFRTFQTNLWQSRFLARHGFIIRDETFRLAAERLQRVGTAGDATHLLQIWKEPASTDDELKIALFSVHRLTSELLKELEKLEIDAKREALRSAAFDRLRP